MHSDKSYPFCKDVIFLYFRNYTMHYNSNLNLEVLVFVEGGIMVDGDPLGSLKKYERMSMGLR